MYTPEKIDLPKNFKVKHIVASEESWAIVSTENVVYMHGEFMDSKDSDFKTGLDIAETAEFKGGDILAIGGHFSNRYAIVKN